MIIGIIGGVGSGKSTVANILVSEGYVEIAFADPLKRIVKQMYDFTDAQLWGPSSKRAEPVTRYPLASGGFLTPRLALQRIGTEVGRQLYMNTWVDMALRDAELVLKERRVYSQVTGTNPAARYLFEPKGVVISDVRFPNEAEAILRAGGGLLRKSGRQKPWWSRWWMRMFGHASDTSHQRIFTRYEIGFHESFTKLRQEVIEMEAMICCDRVWGIGGQERV